MARRVLLGLRGADYLSGGRQGPVHVEEAEHLRVQSSLSHRGSDPDGLQTHSELITNDSVCGLSRCNSNSQEIETDM